MSEFDDPFSIHAQSRPTGRHDENGREIRIVGQPILAWSPLHNNLAVPNEYRRHPLVEGRCFYTLPTEFIEAIITTVGAERFDPQLLAVERALARICRDHSQFVGFWQDKVVQYGEFRTHEIGPISEEMIRENDQSPAKVNFAIESHEDRDGGSMMRFSQGYCGWLLTNQQFLDEHDFLLANHADAVRRWGTYQTSMNQPERYRSGMIAGTDPYQDPLWGEFVADCNAFFVRWRLASLAGPYLPVPSKPLLAGDVPLTVLRQLMGSGGVFYLPDTMHIPSRDQLRSMIDQSLHRGEQPEHLEEWMDIVRADNAARNRMNPFARQFALQHFWRVLHSRHADAMVGNIERCRVVVGRFLNANPGLIKEDLGQIRGRLGADWLERESPI